jgi:ABC-type glycerol-3-phosphate transport system substrate-binding protein
MLSWVPENLSGEAQAIVATGKRWKAAGAGRNFKYTAVDYGSYNTKLHTSLLSGQPPEVAAVNMDQVGTYVKSGQVADLTDWAKKQPKLDQKMVERYMVDGKQYVWWPTVNAQGVMYNKTVFDKLGLTAPKTMDELATVSAELRKAGYPTMASNLKDTWVCGDFWFQGMAYEDASDTLIPKAERGEAKWNGSEFLAAAKYIEKLRDANVFIDGALSISGADAYPIFATQKATMIYPGAVWSYSAIATLVKGEFEIGVFELPPLDSSITPRATGGPSTAVVFPSAAKNTQGALDFGSFLASPSGQKKFAELGSIPAVVDTEPLAKPPYALFAEFESLQKNAATRSILVPPVALALENAAASLLAGQTSAQDVVDAMQAAAK